LVGKRRSKSKTGWSHRFGGKWTQAKLDVLASYLNAYTTALRNQSFRKLYVDAFAGTGYRETQGEDQEGKSQVLLFPDLAAKEPQDLLDGSARWR